MMKLRLRAALAAAFGGLLFTAVPAQAATLVDATDPARLVDIIQDLGYRAQLTTDDAGDPEIQSAVGGAEFSILFFGCTDNRACKYLLFRGGWDLPEGATLDVVNGWNHDKLFGRAHLDDESDPWLEMPVTMDGGVSRTNFEDAFDWWEVIVAEFEDHIGFRQSALGTLTPQR